MDKFWVATLAGPCVLVIATMFVASHYRRERHRRELLRQLECETTPGPLG
jgi:hypothetical protein